MNISINNFFHIPDKNNVLEFFPLKNNFSSRISSILKRTWHYLKTGKLINNSKLFTFAASRAAQDSEKLSDLFKNRVGVNKLKRIENRTYLEKATLVQRIKDAVQFFFQFLCQPSVVGSLAPSSLGLAKTIVNLIPKTLEKDSPSRRILEVGPGTGAFTEQIIRRMGPNDILDLVEFDEKFCETLRKKYHNIPQVHIHHQSITDYNEKEYDFIVSGLPLNAFSSQFVDEVFKKLESLAKDQGNISYFEYMLIPQIKLLFSKRADKSNLETILKLKKDFYKKHQLRTDRVWFNITPANVKHHLVKKLSN